MKRMKMKKRKIRIIFKLINMVITTSEKKNKKSIENENNNINENKNENMEEKTG